MWTYEKKLQYPVNIKNPNPKLARIIITQLGGANSIKLLFYQQQRTFLWFNPRESSFVVEALTVFYDVVAAPRQYLAGYANGSIKYDIPADRLEEMEALARRVIVGEPYDWPDDVIYQDNVKHGIVFKRFDSEWLGTTTYFCYG